MRGSNRIITLIKGLTFLEVLLALSIFAVIFVGISQGVMVVLETSRRTTQETIAINLRGALMSEIAVKNFSDPQDPYNTSIGPNTGEDNNRTLFDDIDDYHGYSDGPPPITVGGLAMDGTVGTPNYTGFSRSVSVINDNATFPVPLNESKRITVNVTTPDGRVYSKYEYKTF